MKRLLSCSLAFILSGSAATQQTPATRDTDLEAAIGLFKEGRLSDALLTLDHFIMRQKSQDPSGNKTLVQALVYRGAALVGVAQEELAKASFREALQHDGSLRLSEREFSARVVRVFEAARTGKSGSVLEPPSTNLPKKAGLGGAAILGIVGGAALIGGGAAIAAGGEAQATPTPPATTLAPAPFRQFEPTDLDGPGSTSISLQSVTPAVGATVSCPGGSCGDRVSLAFAFTSRNPPHSVFDVSLIMYAGSQVCVSYLQRFAGRISEQITTIVVTGLQANNNCTTDSMALRVTTTDNCQPDPRQAVPPGPFCCGGPNGCFWNNKQSYSGGYTFVAR